MGLFLDIVCPASEVLFALEQRGMPLDEQRRTEIRALTEMRRDALRTSIVAAAQAFHMTRRAKIQSGLDQYEAERMEVVSRLGICAKHPKFNGLASLGARKCETCIALWSKRGAERAVVAAARARIVKARALLKRLGPIFRTSAPDDWRAWLFSVEGLGLVPIDLTPKTQAPSIDDDSIEALWKRHPEVDVLRQRVELAHLENRLSGPLAVEAGADGCVHFAYALHRTATGQTSSGADDYEVDKPRSSPGNAQNITESMRQIFAARPGEVVLHADYEQIEARIDAHLSGCDRMIEAFRRYDAGGGPDIHALNAAAIYGIAPADARMTQVRFGGAMVSARYAAKRATHGWDYGMGDFKTARLYGLTVAEARSLRLAYFAAWPELVAFQEEVVRRVERDRFLVNPFGRKLRFYGFAYRDGRWQTTEREEAIAFMVASTAKDIAKAVMPAVDAAALQEGATMRTHTHDSFTFWAQVEVAERVRARVTPLMDRPWLELGERLGAAFRCPVAWSAGRNWAEAHEHDAACAPECDKLNPDGLRKVT